MPWPLAQLAAAICKVLTILGLSCQFVAASGHLCGTQAKYDEYVTCMGFGQSRLTPMPLEDFCRLAGKECRGLPVLDT